MINIVRQFEGPALESRAVMHFATLHDGEFRIATPETLADYREQLKSGDILPVGSCEFIRRAMALADMNEPGNLSYPQPLIEAGFFERPITQSTLGEVRATIQKPTFIKPVTTKLFTGFVLCPHGYYIRPEDREQADVLESLPDEEPVWVCEEVEWMAEFRFYILHNEIIGYARYDDGEMEVEPPNERWLTSVINAMALLPQSPVAYSIDAGFMSNGKAAVVECNDAWALGLYKPSLTAADYIKMLYARWQQLLSLSRSHHG